MAHSDNRKAEALAALDANAGNVAKTARQLGIPRQTLAEWALNRHLSADVPEIRQVKKLALADRLEGIANDLLDSFPDKMAAASLKDVATAFGISVDKMQLLREKPTSIQKTETDLTPEERARRVNELLDAGESRAGPGGIEPGASGGTRPAVGVAN